MIKELTSEQEAQIPIYRDKWLKIGLSTEQINIEKAVEIKNVIYKVLLNKKDVPCFLMDSPMSAYLATMYLGSFFYENNQVENQVENQVRNQVWSQVWNQVRNQVENQVENQVWNQVENQVWNQVRNQVENQVWSQVWNQVWSQVWNQVRNQVRNQVWNQVRNQVWNQVGNQVENQVENQVNNFFFPYLYGNMESSCFSFYDYCFNVLCIDNPVKDLWNAYLKETECGAIYACDDFCVISNKPTKLSIRNGLLHCDGSSSWEYADGLKGWSLNGVAVPEYLAVTPEGKLDIEFFNKEKNADVRTEFVRKYGVQRLMKYGKQIDSYVRYSDEWWSASEYELWDMSKLFNGITYAPHLKMKNLTTGVIHVEAVSPECRILPDAIKERLGGRNLKIGGIK